MTWPLDYIDIDKPLNARYTKLFKPEIRYCYRFHSKLITNKEETYFELTKKIKGPGSFIKKYLGIRGVKPLLKLAWIRFRNGEKRAIPPPYSRLNQYLLI